MILRKEEYNKDFQLNSNESTKRNLQDEIDHKTD